MHFWNKEGLSDSPVPQLCVKWSIPELRYFCCLYLKNICCFLTRKCNLCTIVSSSERLERGGPCSACWLLKLRWMGTQRGQEVPLFLFIFHFLYHTVHSFNHIHTIHPSPFAEASFQEVSCLLAATNIWYSLYSINPNSVVSSWTLVSSTWAATHVCYSSPGNATSVKSGNFVTFLHKTFFFTKICEGTPYFFPDRKFI